MMEKSKAKSTGSTPMGFGSFKGVSGTKQMEGIGKYVKDRPGGGTEDKSGKNKAQGKGY